MKHPEAEADSGTSDGTITVRHSGTYRATATVSAAPQGDGGGPSGDDAVVVCDASVTIDKPSNGPTLFIDVLCGKERRVRPDDGSGLAFAQCSPLLGLKFGVAKRFSNDWEVAGVLGAAISLATDEHKVKQSVTSSR